MDNQILLSDGNQTDSKDFQCPICQKYFSRKFTLDMHLLIHKGIKPHPCPFCGKCFRQKGTLMRHKALHSSNNLFHCSLCNRGFRQKNVFLHHLKHRHNVSTETLDRRKYRTQLKDYQSIMDTLPPFVLADSTAIASSEKHLDAMLFETLSNNICDSSISDGLVLDTIQNNCFDNQIALPEDNLEHSTQDWAASTLNNTSSNQMSENIRYKCDLCLEVYSEYNKYKQHIKQQHDSAEILLDTKPIICALSSESTRNTSNSKDMLSPNELASGANQISPSSEKHVFKNTTNSVSSSNDSISNGQINFCIPCQLTFANEEEFKFHLKTHVQSVLGQSSQGSPEKSSNDFKTTNTYSVPMATNLYYDILSGDNSSCNNLPSLISKSSTLSYLNQKSKVSKQKVLYKKQGQAMLCSLSPKFQHALYKCKLCNKIFQDKLTFEYHKQMHLNARGFDCGYCKRRFVSKQLLLSHTRSKHLKTFKCPSCFRSFNYRSIYDYHEKNCNKNINAGIVLKSLLNLPLIDIQKLLNSDATGIAGVIPICDNSISKNSTFKLGIPVFSIEAIRNLSNIPFSSSFEINGALKSNAV